MGTYLRMHNKDVIRASVLNENELEFIDGLAIAVIRVESKTFYNERITYETVTVIQEVLDENGKRSEFILAGDGSRYFSGERFVSSIERIGDYFFVEVITGEDNVSWSVYKQFKVSRISDNMVIFNFVREVPTRIIPTKNKNIGLLKPYLKKMSLYSIEDGTLIGDRFSSIEEAEDGNFLVVDTVESTVNPNIKDRFTFMIDATGKRITDILSRNDQMEIYETAPGETYEEILKRRISELNSIAVKESNILQQLKLGKPKKDLH